MGIALSQTSSGTQLGIAKHDDCAPSQIQSRPIAFCYLCGSSGKIVYQGLQDRLFEAPGSWNFKLCSNADCGLMWLDPEPLEQEIGKAYAKYYTHVDWTVRKPELIDTLRKWVSRMLSVANPVHHERERLSLMYLDDSNPGKLLDVGCGNGTRLARLRELGWDVCGQDVDPRAVNYARDALGLEVRLGRLEEIRFPDLSFDCITLHHVIEHAHDPVQLLKECRRILKKSGLLVMVTPNSRSFAHKHFGCFWRGLEPPRHIHLFSPKTLSTAVAKAGFTVTRSWTTVANAKTFGRGSLLVRNGGSLPSTLRGKLLCEIYPLGYLYRSIFEHWRDTDSGEECVLRATH